MAGTLERGAQERHVEADVVADEHRVAHELEQRREHRLDPWGWRDQGIREPGEDGDDRRDRPAGVDERLERAEALATADLHRTDLGDDVAGPVATGRLEIEHAERDIGERRPEVVERALHRTLHHMGMRARTSVRVKHLFVLYRWAMVEHRHLRSAIEFAVGVVRARPSIGFPAELKPFIRQPRIPTAALGKLRRAIDADPDFRRRIAVGAVPELVDEIGIEWLRQEDGWEQRVAALVAADREAAEHAGEESAMRKAERRREAAEQVAVRTRADLVALQDRLDAAAARVSADRDAAAEATAAAEAARAELAEARLAVRHANDRAEAARSRLEAVEAERDAARQQAITAERQHDDLLADRAERAAPLCPARR